MSFQPTIPLPGIAGWRFLERTQASQQAAFNVGNAIGASLGGAVIAMGFGFRAPILVAGGLALLGLGVMLLAERLDHVGRLPVEPPVVAQPEPVEALA